MNPSDWIHANLRVINDGGQEITAECPFCGREKLWINPDKGAFICYYGCDSGSIPWLVAKVEGVSLAKAKEKLEGEGARTVGDLRARFDNLRPTRDEADVIQSLPDDFRACFDGRTYHVPEYVEAPLPDGRELEDKALRIHGIGFCERGKYHNRLVVPVHCDGNRTFQTRLMGDPIDFTWTDKTTGRVVTPGKYIAPKGSNIGRFLYWYDHTPIGADIVIVEGIFDAIRLIRLGFHAVATFGKRITDHQLALIVRLRPRSVTVLYDADAKGKAYIDAWKVAKRLAGGGRSVAVAELPGDHDPDSFGARFGRRGLERIFEEKRVVKDRLCSLREALSVLV